MSNDHRPPASNPHKKVSCRGCGTPAGGGPGFSGEHETSELDGTYEVSFYPGFASGIDVNGKPMYRQARTFVLPVGTESAWTTSALTIRDTARDFDVTLHIDDPRHMIHRIHVELLEPEKKEYLKSGQAERPGGGVTAHQSAPRPDTIVVTNTPTICPPSC
jgi:hypothetical protein